MITYTEKFKNKTNPLTLAELIETLQTAYHYGATGNEEVHVTTYLKGTIKTLSIEIDNDSHPLFEDNAESGNLPIIQLRNPKADQVFDVETM